ncbi:unnamed protein product [Fraxinus pennsylvanica]|uniref:RING-type domain-containing protein n=1 Tax=Fraxinus pennsylvanica TaxID=56036 RepID=A0AAD1YYA4_9LAMI|nr:unnamed protein product [Fraxinus pennsylvanica]
MPDILYPLLEVFASIVMFIVIQGLQKCCDRYAELAQFELPVVNRQPPAAPQRAPLVVNRPPPPPSSSSPTSTRPQMKGGKKDEVVIDIYIEQEDGDRECSICLSEFKDQELFRLLPSCNHGFHFHCIKIWLQISRTYPLCRRSTVIEQ